MTWSSGLGSATPEVCSRRDAALDEAVTAFEQLGHVFETARARRDRADLLMEVGQDQEAIALYEAALSVFEELRAVGEATRVRAVINRRAKPAAPRRSAPRKPTSGWGALTRTELEIVEEVCGGRSNPQVAERLGISRRTVEAHLRSVYSKIGVSTRLALSVAHRDRASVAPGHP